MSSDSSSSSTGLIQFQPIEASERDKEFWALFEMNEKLILSAFCMSRKEGEPAKVAGTDSKSVRVR